MYRRRRRSLVSTGEEPDQGAGARRPGFERTSRVLRRDDDTTFFQRGEVLLDALGGRFYRTYLRHGIASIGNGDRRALADQAQHLREPGLGLVCRVDGIHASNLTSLTSVSKYCRSVIRDVAILSLELDSVEDVIVGAVPFWPAQALLTAMQLK